MQKQILLFNDIPISACFFCHKQFHLYSLHKISELLSISILFVLIM
uniref:Uncharacterized protein n=1 Tax=Heterorhabditis bacteriophora TaxID=37862 RepID=A0A1I7WEC2_HETBA